MPIELTAEQAEQESRIDGVIPYPSAELRMRCAPVEAFDSELMDVVEHMENVLHQSGGIALAANQVGIPIDLFVYNTGDRVGVCCNARIMASSDDLWSFREGCLSLPDRFWWINRPRTVTVNYNDIRGGKQTITESDLLGRMLQHEIQHLQGGLIVDLLTLHEWKKLTKSLGYVGAR